jgi:transcriptional regulator with XRE-family HTH domain
VEKESDEAQDALWTKAVAKQLQVDMKEAGLTQRKVSERTGINYQTLGRYLRAERDMDVGVMGAIARVIGVPPEDVWVNAGKRIKRD